MIGKVMNCDISFQSLMLSFSSERLKFESPEKYGCEWARKTYQKTWHFLLRGYLCVTYTVQIIPIVTKGVCVCVCHTYLRAV